MINLLLSLSPIILILILLLVFRRTILFSAPITFIATAILAYIHWGLMPKFIYAASLKGLLVAIDVCIIIFGAIFFLDFLKSTGIIQTIESHLGKVSHDKRIQGIILAWFLCSFIEGTAGFGTPAAIVAPLLVGIGFPAVTAVVISLIADSTAVAFGAVGTPIRIGLEGLASSSVPFYVALINLIVGLIVPIIILIVIVKASKTKQKGAIKEMIPFSIWAGLVLLIPYFLSSYLGQEFPSLIGPLVGLAIIIWTTKKGFLVPKNVWAFEERKIPKKSETNNFKVYFPYVLLVLLLVVGKYVLPKITYSIVDPISHSINTYNPGLLFIITILIITLIYKYDFKYVKNASSDAFKILIKPFIAILFITAFVQIMNYSNPALNTSGLESMVNIIANSLQTQILPFLAPFIGGFGAFIAGSATVSTLLFGSFQSQAATNLGMNTQIILALQVVGAGAANMIALTNIVAAQATVKLQGKDNEILKMTILPALIYLFLAGIIGLFLVYVI